jgi:hypothetical protein
MSMTLADLVEKLKLFDEITLMEILEITSEDLVERFTDKILDKADGLEAELEEEDLSD